MIQINYILISEQLYDECSSIFYKEFKQVRHDIRANLGFAEHKDCSEPPIWIAVLSGIVEYLKEVHNFKACERILVVDNTNITLLHRYLISDVNTINILYSLDCNKQYESIINTHVKYVQQELLIINNVNNDTLNLFLHNYLLQTVLHLPTILKKCSLNYSIIDKTFNYLTKRITNTVGCRYNCKFCSNSKVALINADKVNKQLNTLQDANMVYIGNMSFYSNPIMDSILLDKIYNLFNGRVNVTVQMTVQDFIKHIYAIKNSRISIVELGIECFDDMSLTWLGKQHNVEDIQLAFKLAQKFHIIIAPNIIFGVPIHKINMYRNLNKFISKYIKTGVIGYINVSTLSIYKDTIFHKQLKYTTNNNCELTIDDKLYELICNRYPNMTHYSEDCNEYRSCLRNWTKLLTKQYLND